MTDLDDQQLLEVEARARRPTHAVLKQIWPLHRRPTPDETGTVRLGFGRAIERRDVTDRAADLELMEDVIRVQAVLRGEVFHLLALNPDAEPRLPFVYAVADILGADTVRDASPLWAAMRAGDWRRAGQELMLCQWDRYLGASDDKRRAAFDLILNISEGQPA